MTTELPKSATEAKALGLPRFHTGKPCKRGHVSPRYAVNGTCVACDVSAKNRHGWTAFGEAKVKLHGHIVIVELPRHMALSIRASTASKPSPDIRASEHIRPINPEEHQA